MFITKMALGWKASIFEGDSEQVVGYSVCGQRAYFAWREPSPHQTIKNSFQFTAP